MKQEVILKLVINRKNLFGLWAKGLEMKIEEIIDNKNLKKEDIIKQLKKVKKLFR